MQGERRAADRSATCVSASDFSTDGYRDHSATERRLGNAKLTWKPDDASKLTLVANSVALPKAQDPLGLTPRAVRSRPARRRPVGDRVRHPQDGRPDPARHRLRTPARRRRSRLRALFYGGHRNTQQFQSIPLGPQASPLHPGGVIVLGRDYAGTDLRWTLKTRVGDRPFTLVGGVAYDALSEHRQGYQNFIGTTLGRAGRAAARRGQRRLATSTSTCRARGASPSAGRSTPACATAACASSRSTSTSSGRTRTTAAACATARRCRWSG